MKKADRAKKKLIGKYGTGRELHLFRFRIYLKRSLSGDLYLCIMRMNLIVSM